MVRNGEKQAFEKERKETTETNIKIYNCSGSDSFVQCCLIIPTYTSTAHLHLFVINSFDLEAFSFQLYLENLAYDLLFPFSESTAL